MAAGSWKAATSLADLGELTARWLQGAETHHPGYGDAPDDETSSLVADLAALNRAGFVTDFSQPGQAMREGCGQRAAVSGFCGADIASRIAALGQWTDLIVIAFPPGYDGGHYIPITIDDYHPFSWGGRHGLDELDSYAESCGPEAVEQLSNAWAITVIDPQWGRDRYLWDHLADAVIRQVPTKFDTRPLDEALETDFVW